MLEKELCQVLWAFLKVVLSGSEERVVADRKVGIMHVYRYGNMEADIVLIQLAGNHDISEIKDEVAEIQHLTSMDFELIAVLVIGSLKCPPWFHSSVQFTPSAFIHSCPSLIQSPTFAITGFRVFSSLFPRLRYTFLLFILYSFM